MKTMIPLATALLLSACMHVGDFDAVKGSGTIKTETRQISGFTKVSLEGAMDVYITQGENESVRIEADDNLLKLIETTIDDGELEITNSTSINPSQTIKVYVTARALEAMNVAGSGNMMTQSAFISKTFDVAIAGSGDIMADVRAENIDASIAGSGDITLKGTAGATDVSIAGSGDIKAYDLATRTATIDIAGSGDCELQASEVLTGNIMGSGSIRYKGDPKINSSIMGSGDIEKK